MEKSRVWILGAPDPEMEKIESLLRECGEQIIYATGEDGHRVHSGNAYRCPVPETPEGSRVYAVECIDTLPKGWVRIDHHRPGDPGYGRPPAEFLPASSVGQVIAELARSTAGPVLLDGLQDSALWRPGEMAPCQEKPGGFSLWHGQWVVGTVNPRMGGVGLFLSPESSGAGHNLGWGVPQALVLAAAADHCLAAAYRGECPGVGPDELMRWRVESRAAHRGRSVDDVLADIEAAREALRAAPSVELMGVTDMPHTQDHDWSQSVCDGCARDPVLARDLRGQTVPELPEAAAREGMAFLATVKDRDGRKKVVCQSGSPEHIRAFLEVFAEREDLVDTYGDPERGFAGGYLPAE